MRLLRSSAVVGGFTMGSRILGFVRDIFIAAVLGTGPVAEAFFVALRFPNLFRRLFAEGAFNAAFVPMYARTLEQDGRETALALLREILSVMVMVLSVFVVVSMIVMPWLMYVIAPGFGMDEDGQRFSLAVIFTQITMPYILLMSITAMMGGVLNSHDRFVVAAAAPIILNIVLISILAWSMNRAGIGLAEALTNEPVEVAGAQRFGLYLCIGVTISGLLQGLFLYAGCRRLGVKLSLIRPRLTPGVKRLVVLGVPGAIAAGVTQINIIVSQQIASFQDGAVALLYYADRLYQLPLGVIGIAMGVALLPTLTKRLRADDTQGAANAMNRALEISMALTLPAAMAMLVMPNFLVSGLFQRGEFDASDALGTALAVQAFAVGLPAFVLIKVFAPGFFAREDTKTPMRFAATSMMVNVVAGVAMFWGIRQLFPDFAHVGLAAATSFAGWINAVLLMRALRKDGGLDPDARLKDRMPRVALAVIGMGIVVGLAEVFASDLTALFFNVKLLALIVVTGAGTAVYGVLAIVTGALRPSEILDSVGR
ncbi:murein biosynthesis integral membrane protein MurJ [Maricaulis sp. D1M11]|uniref:murein biosynthesis integral membrane protein MurJ n=1 Tax=Maricaulis sp. D1M11 TaxID=3076117 RepID=UPI0039B57F72